jgi:predicted GTPase
MPTRVVILGAAGRDFHDFNVVFREDPAALAGPRYPAGIPIEPGGRTMLRSTRPVVAVCAVRTGCGKGAAILRRRGRRVAVVRHPMPYGDLAAQRAQRFVDPHRAGHESRYHPGEANLRMADVAVIVKEDTAAVADVEAVSAGRRRRREAPCLHGPGGSGRWPCRSTR